MQNMVIKYKQ